MAIITTGLLIVPSLEANAEFYYADETRKHNPDYSYYDTVKKKLQIKKEMELKKKLNQDKKDKETRDIQSFMRNEAKKQPTLEEQIKLQEGMLKQALEKRKAENKWIEAISKY